MRGLARNRRPRQKQPELFLRLLGSALPLKVHPGKQRRRRLHRQLRRQPLHQDRRDLHRRGSLNCLGREVLPIDLGRHAVKREIYGLAGGHAILRLMMAPMNLAKEMRVRVRIKGDRPLIHSPGPHPQARRKARRRGRTRPRARTKEEAIPVDLGVGDVMSSSMDLADG